MLFRELRVAVVFLTCVVVSLSAADQSRVAILWATPNRGGELQVDRGRFHTDVAASDANATRSQILTLPESPHERIEVSVTPDSKAGALPTLIMFSNESVGFSFVLSEVNARHPIFLPEDGVVVTEASDTRSYDEIIKTIRDRNQLTKRGKIAAAPEASFESAVPGGREMKAQTWLGVSRDIRLFRIDRHLESFQPKFAGYDVTLPEVPRQPATFAFQFGRGWGARDTLRRSLDQGVLPILQGALADEEIHYEATLFTSLETKPLTPENLRGTDYLVADALSHGHMFTPAQAEAEKSRRETELTIEEEVVLHIRVIATNRGATPRHAFFRTVTPSLATPVSPKLPEWTFDQETGFGGFSSGRVFAVSRVNGAPARAEEVSLLLQPGEQAVFECSVPHRPVSKERALQLAEASFEKRLSEVRQFWKEKLKSGSEWILPEPRMDEMVRAGRLHLDLITYGREPHGTLLPAIGLYTAIGSESAPIIQFFDSIGWHDTAERAIDFFLEKQRDDGFMQNFNGYMLETGAVLWTMGEHYRYTRNDAWLKRVHPKVTKAWQFLRDWRARNLQPELKGNGFGMLDGKTADPDDPFRSFMLNGYAYLGLARTAEMLGRHAPEEARQCRELADTLKADIRATLEAMMKRSPVVPFGNGAWGRSAPPWTSYRGPVMLHADGGRWFTHGTLTARDSLLGPLYLVFQEVVSPEERIGRELLELHSELMLRDNVAFSQPYYSRHPWVHLQRGEVKSFLQSWYGTVATLADRETYTFEEHYFPATAHKTHEEAWFLMETRWMLYLESEETLKLMAGVPRSYLQPGRVVGVIDARTYFGTLTYQASVSDDGHEVRIHVSCGGDRRPQRVWVRVPHPLGLKPISVTGGHYSPPTEAVSIENFTGEAEAIVRF